MNKTFIIPALVLLAGAAGWIAWAGEDLRQREQSVLARWDELHAAEQRQFVEVPAVLVLADREPALDAGVRAAAHTHCGPLTQFEDGATLIDDAQRFDRYKQARAECTGAMFRLLAVLQGSPLGSSDGHVQALVLSLTRGQATVDGARERYRQALVAYNQRVHGMPHRVAAAVLGYRERPDFVRYA